MCQEDFLNLLTLRGIKKRIYAALVRQAALLTTQELVNRIRSVASINGMQPSNVRLSSYLDALALKMTPDQYSDFLAGF